MKKINVFLSIILALCLILCSCEGAGDCKISGNHSDSNDDGACDDCRVSLIVTLDFYVLNDLHGKFDDTDSNGGVDELTSYLLDTRFYDDYTVFLSSGDMWQGSSESNLTEGLIITDWMNELDFVAMTLGNHEYDWGEETIKNNLALAEFPFLAINIYDKDTNARVDYAIPSVTVERGGIQIGIIGAMGDCYSSIASDKTESVYFKTGSELSSLVKEEAERLRNSGVDFIVYSIHDGNDDSKSGAVQSYDLSAYYDLALSDGYVDLVFEAHTHKSYVQTDQNGVYHLQGGGDNRGISHAEIKINSVTGTSSVSRAEFVGSSSYSLLPDAEIVDELLDKYADVISKGNEVLGFNGYYRTGEYLADLMARLYTEWGENEYGNEYDIVLGGGYIKLRSPYKLDGGYVKYSDVQTIFPFDNVLTLCSIKGKDLKANFINTENEAYHIYFTDYGNTVKDSILDDETYYVVVDSYTSSYSKNRLTVIESYVEGFYARDLLADYVRLGQLEKY